MAEAQGTWKAHALGFQVYEGNGGVSCYNCGSVSEVVGYEKLETTANIFRDS